jgi:hypothetical protein
VSPRTRAPELLELLERFFKLALSKAIRFVRVHMREEKTSHFFARKKLMKFWK